MFVLSASEVIFLQVQKHNDATGAGEEKQSNEEEPMMFVLEEVLVLM